MHMPESAPHILILSSWYPSEQHPFLGNFVRRHAQLLASKYRVTVINLIASDASEKKAVSKAEDEGITEIQARYSGSSKLSRFGNRSRVFSDALKELDAVDLIIGHVLLPHGWMFLQAQKNLKCPLIWVEHGSYFRGDAKRRWSPRERLIRRSMVARSSEIVAVSETLRKDMLRSIASNEIKVIGNHVDEALFTFKEKSNHPTTQFLHVSTLDPKTKNPEGIVSACSILKEEGALFHLTIVSDEDHSHLKQFAQANGVQDCIDFVGPQEWDAMPQFYHNSDAFILNSDYETFSIVLAESLSTGTPVITTHVGIAPEIPDKAQISVDKNNPESLAKGMRSIIEGKTFGYSEIAELGKQYHSTSILEQWNQLIAKYVG